MNYFSFYFFHHIPSGSEVYIQLVFGSIAFKLFNLGQKFQVAFQKLHTKCSAHSSWQSLCNWVRFIGLLARRHFFSSAHKFSIGLRTGFRDSHSNTLTLLSLSHFATTLEVCLGSLSIWRPICDQALTSRLISSTYPYYFPTSWCHLFCYLFMMLPALCFTVGMAFFGLQASPFFLHT